MYENPRGKVHKRTLIGQSKIHEGVPIKQSSTCISVKKLLKKYKEKTQQRPKMRSKSQTIKRIQKGLAKNRNSSTESELRK